MEGWTRENSLRWFEHVQHRLMSKRHMCGFCMSLTGEGERMKTHFVTYLVTLNTHIFLFFIHYMFWSLDVLE